MKYYSVLVFIIALLSPRRRHVVLADKTSRRKLRLQQEHVPSTRRLEKPNEPTASSIENQQVGRRHRNNALSLDNQQGGRRGRNKRGKGGKDSPPEINPNNQPITLPAPSTSKTPTTSPVMPAPTSNPAASPSSLPSSYPTLSPSHKPTITPSQLPTQVPSLSPSSAPTLLSTNKPTLPTCLGSEYNKDSQPYKAGNFAYYSANGEEYEYFYCRADELCNLKDSPGRPGWFLQGYCNPPSAEDVVVSPEVSSSGCPEPWRNSATYSLNDYASANETDGTVFVYKCYSPEHCKTIAPGGPRSKDAWFVDGVC